MRGLPPPYAPDTRVVSSPPKESAATTGPMPNSAAIAAESGALPGRIPPQSRHGLQDAVDLLANLDRGVHRGPVFARPGRASSLHAAAWHTLSRAPSAPRTRWSWARGWWAGWPNTSSPVDVDRYQAELRAPRACTMTDEGIRAFLGVPVGELGGLGGGHQELARSSASARKKIIRDFGVFMGQMVAPAGDLRPGGALRPHPGPALRRGECGSLSFSGTPPALRRDAGRGAALHRPGHGLFVPVAPGPQAVLGGGGAGPQRGHPAGPLLPGEPRPGGLDACARRAP